MRRFTLLAAASCLCLSSAYASDQATDNVAEAAQGKPNPAGRILALERPGIDQAALRSFVKPRAIDPAEAVIRVYGADGTFEERKIRFGSLPREFVLDLGRRTERVQASSAADAAREPLPESVRFSTLEVDPLLYAPIEIVPTLSSTNSCR